MPSEKTQASRSHAYSFEKSSLTMLIFIQIQLSHAQSMPIFLESSLAMVINLMLIKKRVYIYSKSRSKRCGTNIQTCIIFFTALDTLFCTPALLSQQLTTPSASELGRRINVFSWKHMLSYFFLKKICYILGQFHSKDRIRRNNLFTFLRRQMYEPKQRNLYPFPLDYGSYKV